MRKTVVMLVEGKAVKSKVFDGGGVRRLNCVCASDVVTTMAVLSFTMQLCNWFEEKAKRNENETNILTD